MLKTLVKIRLQSLLSGMMGGRRTKNAANSPVKKFLFALLGLYVAGTVGFLFGSVFMQLCRPFFELGIGWFYFSFAGLAAFALMFIGSVFTTQAQIYDAKDNELLLAMPIRPRDILFSRMALLLALNLFFEALVMGPAAVVYIMAGLPVTVLGVVSFLVVCLCLPCLSFAVSGVFAWGLSVLASRIRNKSLVTTVGSLAFLAAYFYFYSKLNAYIGALVLNGQAIAAKLSAAAPLYWMGNAIASRSLPQLLLFALCALLPFTLVTAALARSFVQITTTRRGFAKIRYVERAAAQNSVGAALLKRELRRFASSPVYMMNAGLGLVFIVAAGVALIVKRGSVAELVAQLAGFQAYVSAGAIAALCLLTSMNLISAPSVSLEGNRLWIVRSLPVATREVLLAKVKLHLLFCLPPILFTSFVAALVLRLPPLMTAFTIITPVVMTVFGALFGLWANLKNPKLDWISETYAVKQSAAVLITMFGGWGVILGPGLLYLFVLKSLIAPDGFVIIFTALLAAACYGLYEWITRRGVKIFESL